MKKNIIDGASLDKEEFEKAYQTPLTPDEQKEIEKEEDYLNEIFGTENHSFLSAQTSRSRELFSNLFSALEQLCIHGPEYGCEKNCNECFEEFVVELRKMDHLGFRE